MSFGYCVDFEALRDKHGEFVVKELGITKFSFGSSHVESKSHSFISPHRWSELPSKIQRSNSWNISNGHGLPWSAGVRTQQELPYILKNLDGPIYVKGAEKALYIYKVLERLNITDPIHEIGEMDCPKFQDLPSTSAKCYIHGTSVMSCAYKKSRVFARWIAENLTEHPSYLP